MGWDVPLVQRWEEKLWFGIQGEDAFSLMRAVYSVGELKVDVILAPSFLHL